MLICSGVFKHSQVPILMSPSKESSSSGSSKASETKPCVFDDTSCSWRFTSAYKILWRASDQWHTTNLRWPTHQPATAPLRIPAIVKMPFTNLVSIVRWVAASYAVRGDNYQNPYVPSAFRRTTEPYVHRWKRTGETLERYRSLLP